MFFLRIQYFQVRMKQFFALFRWYSGSNLNQFKLTKDNLLAVASACCYTTKMHFKKVKVSFDVLLSRRKPLNCHGFQS